MFDDNFMGAKPTNVEGIDFIGITSNSEQEKIFKKTKQAFDTRESELFGSRAPLHQGASPTKKAGRGNSPATGALVDGPTSEPVKNTSIESKSQLNHQASSATLNNCDDSFQKLYSKELDLDEDEVPLILHELNDSAIHFISKD